MILFIIYKFCLYNYVIAFRLIDLQRYGLFVKIKERWAESLRVEELGRGLEAKKLRSQANALVFET